MSTWGEVRRLARQRHQELAGLGDELVPAGRLLDAAAAATRLTRIAVPAGDVLLNGAEAAYDHDRREIYYAEETAEPVARFHVAHEFAHHWLDEAGAACAGCDLDVSSPSAPEESLVGEVDAYSPKERAEALANVFAREFLVPREKLRRRCLGGDFVADAIAAELGVPVDLVMHQLADALLLPASAPEPPPRPESPPDDSQREAIECPPGPRLVRAGPGSGKTRTLVGRAAHLISQGEDPASILALTYSNLSAQDLASRIRAAVGERATAVWSGTFHAYGLELLRKYGGEIGFTRPPKLLDRTDSLMLLEELLPQLGLQHHLNLYDPVLPLKSLLGAIGRAKDELVSPVRYTELGRAMRDAAATGDDEEAAEKAIEVGRVYTVYDRTLRERGLVDFGDLVALPVTLLRDNPEVAEAVRAERAHVLVDEYQDMNHASSQLLREVVTPGRGPWVVGDVRQAIYRFRGASPLNMTRFAGDFPGAAFTDLSVNYRSGGAIVRTFETFGRQMVAGRVSSQKNLSPHRGENTGAVTYDIAATREAEANGVAERIRAHVSGGGRYADHAVLARSHITLARLVRHFERCGIPCLYFGDFFERPEVQDLLALLSLVAEPHGPALMHVAQFHHYGVSHDDIVTVFAWRRAQKVSTIDALRRLDEIDGVSPDGRPRLARLLADVSFADWPMPPHRFLTNYLFGRPDPLRRLLADGSVAGQQRLLAIYQLLQFAFAFKAPKGCDPKRAFLDHVRRLEVLDEEKQLRQLPAAARDIDAVRLMTVHASKGLEFPVVHLATLGKGQFPLKNQAEACPPPDGMTRPDDLLTKGAEEESLFFVALSRARDALHLSRSKRNGGVNATPSPFLDPIAGHLPGVIDGAAGWAESGPSDPPHPRLTPGPTRTTWAAYELEAYERCPRQFYYAHVLGLPGTDERSVYLRFQSAIRASVGWLRGVPSAEERRAGVAARFDSDWAAHGPVDHAFEPIYRPIARRMIDHAVAAMDGESLPHERTVRLPDSGTVVSCGADGVQRTAAGPVVLRLKASRLAKTEKSKTKFDLVQAAVCSDDGVEAVTLTHVSLLTGDRVSKTTTRKELEKVLRKLEVLVQNAAAGDFAPAPARDDECPTCPYFFVCPSHGTPL
ncbi:MAG: hypothetical protein C0501_23220 [Isosphaera sp.]|nr:hypothetical protein [Isosphaera sp.]